MSDVIFAASGSGRVRSIAIGIKRAQDSGLNVWTALTMQASKLVDPSHLKRLTGNDVVAGDWPDAGSPFPDDRKVLFAPATFNSVSKLALGIADSPPTTVAAKAVGLRKCVLVAVSMDDGLRSHPLQAEYRDTLQSWGVDVCEFPADMDDEDWWKAVVDRFLTSEL